MKVAIYGQYYQNSTEPIIKDIFLFFKNNNVEMVIEENFLQMLHEKQLVQKEYPVEPVGVEIINPSAQYEFRYSLFK